MASRSSPHRYRWAMIRTHSAALSDSLIGHRSFEYVPDCPMEFSAVVTPRSATVTTHQLWGPARLAPYRSSLILPFSLHREQPLDRTSWRPQVAQASDPPMEARGAVVSPVLVKPGGLGGKCPPGLPPSPIRS